MDLWGLAIVTDSQLITLVDLLQPLCTRTYGSAPCDAALGVTGAAKCYNTRATCQDAANYNAGTLTLRFSKPQENVQQFGNVFPFINSLNITPLTINFGGMDPSMSPFGRRESVSISFTDCLHSDHLVDPYRLERPTGAAGTVFDPYTSGSFWGKWIARNPYHEGMILIVRQGLGGDLIDDMEARYYVVDRIAGPNDGTTNLVGKDLFSLVESRKAKAPLPSPCELRTGLPKEHTGYFLIVPAELADEYPAGEFRVAINDEIIRVIRDENALNIVQRGDLGTEPDDHDGSDKVQLVLEYSSLRADVILNDLLTNYSVISGAYIPLAEWQAEMETARPELLSAYIAEPTPVEQLIGELAAQVGFTIWPSVTENLIKLKVLQSEVGITPTVDDDYWILRGTYAAKRMDTQRVSQVWVYYGQRNPLGDQKDPANYRSRRIFADLEAEGADQYGTPAIREVFSRWIPQFAGTFATTAGNRILSLFRDPPLRATFSLHRRRAGELSVAELFLLETREDQDALGQLVTRTMAPIELYREEERIIVQAQEVRFTAAAPDDKTIVIEEDAANINLLEIYTALYGTPVPGEVVVFQVLAAVVISSTDAALPALDTGDWPTGIDLRLELGAGAKVVGKGGDGGAANGSDGEDGGTAIFVQANLVIENNGTIAGAGGGGGGGWEQYLPYGAAGAQGGGGAGILVGQGANDGTETLGGEGGIGFTNLPEDIFGPGALLFAQGGNGGDLGQPGGPGSYGGLGNTQTAGEGGAAGIAIDGAGYVVLDPAGTIIGDVADGIDTTFDPAPVPPSSLVLEAETTLTSAADYVSTMIFRYTKPVDSRVISFEAQVQTARAPGTWRPLFDAYIDRHEWSTSEIGVFRVRVRSVYLRGEVYSSWAYAQYYNLGPFEALSEVGMDDPIDPKLFITTNREKATARIRITAGYDPFAEVTPDRLMIFYSVADNPNALDVTVDEGDKLRINTSTAIAGTFTMPVAAGSTTTSLNYDDPAGQFDPDLVGYWWVQVDDGVSPTPYLKAAEADGETISFAPGDAYPYVPEVGDTINVVEAEYSDSRLEEFRLLYRKNPSDESERGEVIRHNGVRRDGTGYYIEVEEREAEGTTEQDWSSMEAHYFPAPGPLTAIIEIPAGNFGAAAGQINYAGDVNLNLPTNIVWASISCCLARRTAEGSRTRYVRSNIVPLPIAGPA